MEMPSRLPLRELTREGALHGLSDLPRGLSSSAQRFLPHLTFLCPRLRFLGLPSKCISESSVLSQGLLLKNQREGLSGGKERSAWVSYSKKARIGGKISESQGNASHRACNRQVLIENSSHVDLRVYQIIRKSCKDSL